MPYGCKTFRYGLRGHIQGGTPVHCNELQFTGPVAVELQFTGPVAVELQFTEPVAVELQCTAVHCSALVLS